MKRFLLVLTAVVLMSQALATPAPSQPACTEIKCRRECGCPPGCPPTCLNIFTCACDCLCS